MRNDVRTGDTRFKVMAAIIAIVVVLVALLLFIVANSARITEQNDNYLQNSTNQSARRINDLLNRSLDIVESVSYIFEHNVDPTSIDPVTIATDLKIESFDYTLFVDSDGYSYRDKDGEKADVSDTIYFQQGMLGQSGIVAVAEGAYSNQNLLMFYAPIFYQGEVYGVFCGAYLENTISQYYMRTTYFGHDTPTYLVTPNGLIVARSVNCENDPDTLQQLLDKSNTEMTFEEISSDIEEGRSVSFNYQADEHGGDTYLTKLENFDWILMRSFPNAITKEMVERASAAGIILVAGVLVAAAVIVIVLAVQSRRQREVLLFERQEATRIIDASTELFYSMLEIDLQDNTYNFLKTDNSLDIPSSGDLTAFLAALAESGKDEYDKIALREMSPENMKKKLSESIFYQFEYKTNDSGKTRWVQVSVLKVGESGDPNISKVLVTVQDTTETKEKELRQHEALEEAFKAAEYASKAKSDFLNNMSHDIRTPMNTIMGLTALASMHMNEPQRVQEYLTNISAASHHLLGLINEVLDMSKIESGNVELAEESFEIPEIMDNLMTIICPQVDAKQQQLRFELSNIEHERVIGDPTRLQQVFVNIMGNSVKFTDVGGEITLRLTELPSRIRGNATYEFQFSDTGCGMTPEFADTLFEPFTRAKDTRTTEEEGTGLGMAITKNIVNLMNGSIDVESEVGKGTTFTVVVNLKIDDSNPLASELSGRVLVVDDELATCEATCAMLEEIGMETEYALDGESAIEKVMQADDANNGAYDVVIMDWKMPGMSGVEAAREIRAKIDTKLFIVVCSGYDWSAIENEARAAGVDAFVMKPLFRCRLMRLLGEFIGDEDPNSLDQSEMLSSLGLSGKHVLLAEDNPMSAEVARELVEMTGAEVTHAENGKIAYESLLSSEDGYYDMVLMDIQMPIMNGYDATRAIREAGTSGRTDLAEIPIIALSADAFADDIKTSSSAGMNEHMAKPLEIEPLVKMLRKWVVEKTTMGDFKHDATS